MNNLPIGIFDSGLGGLTVLRELIKVMPNEKYIYLGDTARVPYGTRSDDIVTEFALQDSQFLVSKKIKCLVIACNTASSIASNTIRKKFIDIPVFDVVTSGANSVKGVNLESKGTIGIIGTSATIRSGKYRQLIQRINPKANVIQKACPLFVPLIEEFEVNSELTDMVINKYFKDLNWKLMQYLILGCTHYPIIESRIRRYINHNIEIINPGEYVALDVYNHLKTNGCLNTSGSKGKVSYYITDITENFVEKASLFLGFRIHDHTYKASIK